jgi:hypothetical protein
MSGGGASTNTISVLSYGAVPDGVTDCTSAINSCLAAAHTQAKNVFFPAGIYLCNTANGSNQILLFNPSGLNNIIIYGQGATIKTTLNSASIQLFISASSACSNIIVQNLTFLNTHGKITGQTNAVYMTGNGQNITTPYIQNCSMTGFSTAIVMAGCNSPTIAVDSFLHPHGHDDAEQNSDPAVDIWFFDNGSGYCTNITVKKCYGRGYTGTFPMNCKRPMDGMIYGTGYGYYVANNDEAGYCQEYNSIAPPSTTPLTTATILFENNLIDQTLFPNSQNDDGSPLKQNYGIRIDASHATVRNNTFKNTTWGFLHRGIDFPTGVFTDYNVYNNTYILPNQGDTTYLLSPPIPIFLQGNTTNPTTFVNVHDNHAYNRDTAYTQTSNCTSPLTPNNLYSPVILP